MKRNATIRIIAYSVALLIMLSILGVGISGKLFAVDQVVSETTKYEVPLASDEETVSTVVDAADVRELDIDWAAGSITILPDEYTTEITVIEPKMTNEKHQMRCNLKNGKLGIQYREETIGISGIDFSKELLIVVPAAWQCEALCIDAAAASVDVQGMDAANVEINAASGICNFRNCRVSKLDVETASGDMIFDGILNYLDFEAMSANCHLILNQVPITIEMESVSGDLVLELPEDAGFALQMDALSGEFNTDFDVVEIASKKFRAYGKKNECMINLSALSGDVTVCKHVHTEDCIGTHNTSNHH